MSFLTLDIETVPRARYVDLGAYAAGDFVLEQDWYAEHHHDADDVKAAIEDGCAPLEATHVAPSLHATTCHIVQVSFGWRDAATGNVCKQIVQSDDFKDMATLATLGGATGLELADRAEVFVVSKALDIISGACNKRTTIVSFNGKQFDVPVLRARAALVKIPAHTIPWRRLLYPYADDQHADLRLILSADDRRARGTLQWWAGAFGIHAEEHGAEVFDWVRSNQWDKLNLYGHTEAATLVQLYERVLPVL